MNEMLPSIAWVPPFFQACFACFTNKLCTPAGRFWRSGVEHPYQKVAPPLATNFFAPLKNYSSLPKEWMDRLRHFLRPRLMRVDRTSLSLSLPPSLLPVSSASFLIDFDFHSAPNVTTRVRLAPPLHQLGTHPTLEESSTSSFPGPIVLHNLLTAAPVDILLFC